MGEDDFFVRDQRRNAAKKRYFLGTGKIARKGRKWIAWCRRLQRRVHAIGDTGPASHRRDMKKKSSRMRTSNGIKNYWFMHGTVCDLPCRFDCANGLHGRRWNLVRFMFPATWRTSENGGWNAVCWEAGKGIWGFCRAGWGARNTPAPWKRRRWPCTGTRSAKRINVWEAGT